MRRIAAKFPIYQAAAHSRGIATVRGYRLSAEDVLRRAVIGRLLCHTVIPRAKSNTNSQFPSTNISRPNWSARRTPQSEGLVNPRRDEIRVTPLGRLFIRNVAMPFDLYLREQQMDAKPAVLEDALGA